MDTSSVLSVPVRVCVSNIQSMLITSPTRGIELDLELETTLSQC